MKRTMLMLGLILVASPLWAAKPDGLHPQGKEMTPIEREFHMPPDAPTTDWSPLWPGSRTRRAEVGIVPNFPIPMVWMPLGLAKPWVGVVR